MEPVSSLAIILATLAAKSTVEELTGTVLGGLVEGLTGIAVFEALPKYVKGLLPTVMFKSQPPVNHNLQKAILSAHWMATWVITDELQKQAEKQRMNEAAHKAVINAAKNQLKKLKDETYLPVTSPDAYEAAELILKDPNLKPVTTLSASVIEFHLAELRTHSGRAHELPAYKEIEEAIRNGQTDWFDLVCAFLNELLKGENNKAKDAFQNQELAKISIETGKLMQKMEEYSLTCISRIGEEMFKHFKDVVSNELKEIKVLLTKIEDHLIRLHEKMDTMLVLHSNMTKESKELNLDTFPDFKLMSEEIEVLNQDFEKQQKEIQQNVSFREASINEEMKSYFEANLLKLNQESLNIDKQINKKKAALAEFRDYIEKTWLSLYSSTISPRLLQAREKFEQGDLAAANSILNPDQLQYEYNQLELISALVTKKKEYLSQEYLAKANFTVLEKTNTEWFNEAKEYYQKAIQLQGAFDTYNAFANFLDKHRQFGEAIIAYQKLLTYVSSENRKILATIFNNMAVLHQAMNEHLKAEEYYLKALQIYRRMTEYSPYAIQFYIAFTLKNLASLQYEMNEYLKAEKNYLKALQIYRHMASSRPQDHESNLASTLNNLALLYQAMNEHSKAEIGFIEALLIRYRLAENNPDIYESDLAFTLNNLASLQYDMNEHSTAEKYYLEALVIRRRLAESNPYTYESDLAFTLNNLALLYQAMNEHSKAEIGFIEALLITERLAESNLALYQLPLAKIQSTLAAFYHSNLPKKDLSLQLAYEATKNAASLREKLPSAMQIYQLGFQIWQEWDEDLNKYLEDNP